MLWPNGKTTMPTVTSDFGPRAAPTPGASTVHRGTDFVGFPTVRSVDAGTVVIARDFGGWPSGGTQVWIQHRGFFTRSLHLSKVLVREGQKVDAGTAIGVMGDTGTATGKHLHFEVTPGTLHYRNEGQVDPVKYLGGKMSIKPTWAPGTKDQKAGWSWSRNGNPVTGCVLHHQANGGGMPDIQYMVRPNDRDSHPTYATDREGGIYGIVHPRYSPHSTSGGGDIDEYAVTIEIANVGGGPDWPVSAGSIESVAQIIAHHARQSPRGSQLIEINKPGVTQLGFWVAYHSQYHATACPGNFVRARMGAIVKRANEILFGTGRPAVVESKPFPPVSKPKPSPKKVAPRKPPKFPLPKGWYFGPESGPVESVSGYHGRGEGLRVWQQQMQDRGWDIQADGRYGDETGDTAEAFQIEKNLEVDRLIGPETWGAAWTEPIT